MHGSDESNPVADGSATGSGAAGDIAAALDGGAASIDALRAKRAATLALPQALPTRPFRPYEPSTVAAPPARTEQRIRRERVSGAHGWFECDVDLSDITQAAPFAAKGRRTPVFVRFSTMASEVGTGDAMRDVRGFAVRFDTGQGIWDLVGRNMPVSLVRDPATLVGLAAAARRDMGERSDPDAAAEVFWDVASRAPESAHFLMWALSDRALPRSYRMMQGFGVHAFRLIDAAGQARYCRFHWTPAAGVHSLTADEAAGVAACDRYFLHRDLWDAVASGHPVAWSLGIQVFTQRQADELGIDPLDATRLVPEELVPLRTVGRLLLDRNPNNLLAETERVVFNPANVVPGIALADDPALLGRLKWRLGAEGRRGDPMAWLERCVDTALVDRPGDLQAGQDAAPPAPGAAPRARIEAGAASIAQAALFSASQSGVERAHIAAAFVAELGRVATPSVRERVVGLLREVDEDLATQVARGLRLPLPEPMRQQPSAALPRPRIAVSAALSQFAFPGDGSIAGRRIAVLVADGADAGAVRAVHATLACAGARTSFVGAAFGRVSAADGSAIEVEATFESMPSPLWDAVVVDASVDALAGLPIAVDFLRDQFTHLKTMWFLGAAPRLLAAAGIGVDAGAAGAGILHAGDGSSELGRSTHLFMQAVARHRHPEREGNIPAAAGRAIQDRLETGQDAAARDRASS